MKPWRQALLWLVSAVRSETIIGFDGQEIHRPVKSHKHSRNRMLNQKHRNTLARVHVVEADMHRGLLNSGKQHQAFSPFSTFRSEEERTSQPQIPIPEIPEGLPRPPASKLMAAIDMMRAEICATMKMNHGIGFLNYDKCYEFMKRACRPGDDKQMDGDPSEVTSGRGYCHLYFPIDPERCFGYPSAASCPLEACAWGQGCVPKACANFPSQGHCPESRCIWNAGFLGGKCQAVPCDRYPVDECPEFRCNVQDNMCGEQACREFTAQGTCPSGRCEWTGNVCVDGDSDQAPFGFPKIPKLPMPLPEVPKIPVPEVPKVPVPDIPKNPEKLPGLPSQTPQRPAQQDPPQEQQQPESGTQRQQPQLQQPQPQPAEPNLGDWPNQNGYDYVAPEFAGHDHVAPAPPPGPSPHSGRWHMDEKQAVPEQGFEGDYVAHDDMITMTGDWLREHDHGNACDQCEKHPENRWCYYHCGKGAPGYSSAAAAVGSAGGRAGVGSYGSEGIDGGGDGVYGSGAGAGGVGSGAGQASGRHGGRAGSADGGIGDWFKSGANRSLEWSIVLPFTIITQFCGAMQ